MVQCNWIIKTQERDEEVYQEIYDKCVLPGTSKEKEVIVFI